MRLFYTLFVGLYLIFSTLQLRAADIKWMLMGVVVEKEALQPIENMVVCLEIKDTETSKTCYKTSDDGHFHFPLEKDKEYVIYLLDSQNNIVKSRELSTLGKESPEIMHLLFEY